MKLDLVQITANTRKAATEDLLDRVTVYRVGMEPAAIEVIEAELARRGVNAAGIRRHAERQSEVLTGADGYARKCSHCHAPAIVQGWHWLMLWGRVPILPWHFRYCRDHLPPL